MFHTFNFQFHVNKHEALREEYRSSLLKLYRILKEFTLMEDAFAQTPFKILLFDMP